MAYAVLVILTIVSCLLFEFSKLPETLQRLIASYRHQFKVMSDTAMSDEAKQKELMKQVSRQLILLGKLILGILLFIAPFFSLFLLKEIDARLHPDILIKWWGLLIPIVTVVVYIFFKKRYGRIHGKR